MPAPTRRIRNLLCLTLLLGVIAAAEARAVAAPRPCGTRGQAAEPTAGDALFVLRGSVGLAPSCGPCLCDVDSNGVVSTTDALAVLRRSVGVGELSCPTCNCLALTMLRTGLSPRSVVLADIDRDGREDLVTADLRADELSIFRARGRGVFEDRDGIPTGTTPQSVAMAELDGNRFLDAITANALTNDLTVLLGSADGPLGGAGLQHSVAVGTAPINVAPARLNADKLIDLVVANSLSDDLSILIGKGDGTFQTEQRIPVGSGPRWVTTADIDDDGEIDVITANRDSNDLSILVGDGQGGFAPERRIPVPAGPYHVLAAYIDGDQRLDLVTANIGAGGVAVLLADEDGGFRSPLFYSTNGNAIAASVVDLDNDGATDIVAANFNQDRFRGVAVLMGGGDGTFAGPVLYPAGNEPRAVVAALLDDDETLDLAVANADDHSDTLSILHGNGDGTFVVTNSPAPPKVGDLAVADFDNDDRLDAATSSARNGVAVQLGNFRGLFDPPIQDLGGIPINVLVADMNGDGNLDLVLPSLRRFVDIAVPGPRGSDEELGPRTAVLFGQGDGTFVVTPVTADLPLEEVFTGDSQIASVTGDEVPDLVLVSGGEIVLLAGTPQGTFEAYDTMGTDARAVRAGDLDDDGDDDVVALTGGDVIVFANMDGVFGPPQHHAVSAHRALRLADVTGDGAVDITVIDTEGLVSVLRGNGNGGFEPERTSEVGPLSTRFTLEDFDGDGFADLAGLRGETAVVTPGDGKGRFGTTAGSAPLELRVRPLPIDVESGNFYGEARADLLTVGQEDGGRNRLIVLPDVGNCLVR